MTPNRAQFLRAFCNEFDALAPESFWMASESELAAACNGVGPEHWPACLRHMLTLLLRPLEASAEIHDWEYSLPHKSFRSFTAANVHLAANVILEAVYDCRPVCMLAGILAAFVCQVFGWRAYKNGGTSPPRNQSAAPRAETQCASNPSVLRDSKSRAEMMQRPVPGEYREGRQ